MIDLGNLSQAIFKVIPGKLEELIEKINGIAGIIMKKQTIQLSPTMPTMNPTDFAWACIGDLDTHKIIFKCMIKTAEFVKVTDWIICNSFIELDIEMVGSNH